jgi:hypothetical protein
MNALDAMNDCSAGQKHLSVSVRADAPGQVCVAVRDSGAGLPPHAPADLHKNPVHWPQSGAAVDRGGMLRRSCGPEAAALVWAVGSRRGFAAMLAQVGEAAGLKNSEREPHAHVQSGDLAELVASDQCDVRP